MKVFFILFLLGAASARPQLGLGNLVPYITKYLFDTTDFGGYSLSVETSDGFKHDQTGEIKNAGTDNEALSVTGSYSYVGPDGVTYTVEYIADENGFQPAGAHLPPSAGVRKLGLPAGCEASLCGGGIG